MEKLSFDFRFQTPCSLYVSGPTMSGKTTFTFELLANVAEYFHPVPLRKVYMYGVWQESFNNLDSSIELVSGLTSLTDENFFEKNIPTLLILDDLMEEISNNPKLCNLFTRDVHHKNVSVIFMSQNLYKQGKNMRDIALNSQYLVLFKSVRDMQQIRVLARQLDIPHVVDAYRKAIKEPYNHLVINLHPQAPEIVRLQSNTFGHRKIYVEK